MFSGTAAPKASPFDPFDYAQGRLRSGQALSRASAFDHQANHIGLFFKLTESDWKDNVSSPFD